MLRPFENGRRKRPPRGSESRKPEHWTSSAPFGLQVGGYDPEARTELKRLGGHMLQIFISKKVVKKYVYHSKAFGIPIDTELDVWLATPEAVGKELDGQVRILFDPELFLTDKGRLFHYCGDWEFLGGDEEMKDSRAAFVAEIRRVLAPVRKIPVHELQSRLRSARPGQAPATSKKHS